jgi:DNA-directed RNA polymerase subunit RPC12/RpoP
MEIDVKRRAWRMDKEAYICRKCGFEFKAIPGEEEPPECPECQSDEIEKLELATIGRTTGPSAGPTGPCWGGNRWAIQRERASSSIAFALGFSGSIAIT